VIPEISETTKGSTLATSNTTIIEIGQELSNQNLKDFTS
jgi:hypothetical protein